MFNQVVEIDRSSLDAAAEAYLRAALAALFAEAEASLAEALALRDRWIEAIQPRGVFSRFDRQVIGERGLQIGSLEFPCPAMARLNPAVVVEVCAFVITVGEIWPPDKDSPSTAERQYADLCGNAYLGAISDQVHQLLKNQYEPQMQVYFPDTICPGYYGLPLEKLHDLFEVVDGGRIGVTLQGLRMMPPKSAAGFYLLINDPAQADFLGERCQYCQPGSPYCAICRYHLRQERII